MIRVPSELIEFKQWVLWKRVNVGGRTAKLPISAWSGKASACDKPETWTSFRHACYAVRKYKADGVEFVFTPSDAFCGIDLDHCRDSAGKLTSEAAELVRKIKTAIPRSHRQKRSSHHCQGCSASFGTAHPRARGLHGGAVLHDQRQARCRNSRRDRGTQRRTSSVHKENFGTASQEQTAPAVLPTAWRSDSELIRRALGARSGTTFGSGNAADIDRLFRMSGLMRDKWNRKTGGETYGARTIRLSLRR
jgi:hypothetical protein